MSKSYNICIATVPCQKTHHVTLKCVRSFLRPRKIQTLCARKALNPAHSISTKYKSSHFVIPHPMLLPHLPILSPIPPSSSPSCLQPLRSQIPPTHSYPPIRYWPQIGDITPLSMYIHTMYTRQRDAVWVYDGGQEGEGKERGFISVAGVCRGRGGLECSEGGKGFGIDMENQTNL